jgi:hypothetical protein
LDGDGPIGLAEGRNLGWGLKILFWEADMEYRASGSLIMDCLEAGTMQQHGAAILDASLPAVCFYEHRGYRTVGHGVKLVYEIMEKRLGLIGSP